MLLFNLDPIFQARGIDRPYTFLVKAGLSPHTATSILNKKTRIFRLDHVELLCRILVCEPHDLLLWKPDKGQQYADNFPLAKLGQSDQGQWQEWQEKLATLPFKELKEAAQTILTPDNS